MYHDTVNDIEGIQNSSISAEVQRLWSVNDIVGSGYNGRRETCMCHTYAAYSQPTKPVEHRANVTYGQGHRTSSRVWLYENLVCCKVNRTAIGMTFP